MKERSIQSIADACRPVFEKQPVAFAYLFGSVAHGAAMAESDADIAVFLPEEMTREERFEIRLALIGEATRVLKSNADVIVLNDIASLFFKYVVVKEGVLVYKKSEEARIDFENKTLSLYFDFLPFLNQYNRAYVQRGIQ